MNRVTVRIETDSAIRPSEIVADLRSAAETLYYPMTVVGFWDYRLDIHLCPQAERRMPCPHRLPCGHRGRIDYRAAMERERQANLEVFFPHADIALFLL